MPKQYEAYDQLIDFRSVHGFANIISLKHTAETLFMSQATAKSKIRQGYGESGLRGVKIKNDYYVFSDSVEAELEIERNLHLMTISFLLDNLEQGNTSLTYFEAMNHINLRHHIASERTKFAKILGRISIATHEISCSLITVIIHSKDKSVPGDGFFRLCEWLNDKEGEEIYDIEDPEWFVEIATESVLKKLNRLKRDLPAKMEKMYNL